MSAHQALLACYANPLITVDSADFDGTNDYMTSGAGLTGAADSETGILSVWVRKDGGDGVAKRVLSATTTVGGTTESVAIGWGTDNKFYIACSSLVFGSSLDMNTSSAFTANVTWLHILASWNLSTGGAHHLYAQDVSDKVVTLFENENIDYTVGDWGIGARPDGTGRLNSSLAEVYFAPGQYLDFSNVYNRRKFISASGKPVHLGTTGALPTGTAPLVYQHLDDAEAVANFATNRGTGGNFSITGTLATGSDSPSG